MKQLIIIQCVDRQSVPWSTEMIRYARDARATGRALKSDKRIGLRRGCFLLGLDVSGRQVAAAQIVNVLSGNGGRSSVP